MIQNLHKIFSENISNSLQPENIIGILWEEVDDMLVFDFSEICETYKTVDITKRNVLNPLLRNVVKRALQTDCQLEIDLHGFSFMTLLAFYSISILIYLEIELHDFSFVILLAFYSLSLLIQRDLIRRFVNKN